MKRKRGLSVSVMVWTGRREPKPPVDLLEIRVDSLAGALARAWIERGSEDTALEQGTLVNAKKP